MSWLINGLGHVAGAVVTAVLDIIGFFMTDITKALFTFVVLPLLKATIFHPYTFANGTLVGKAASDVWSVMAAGSAGVALVMLLFGVFSRMAGSIGGQKSWAEMGEGLAVWLAVLVGGWGFLNLLLGISDVGTSALITGIQNTLPMIFATNGQAFGLASAGLAVFTKLLWPLSGIAIAALAIWAVGVWLMRQVDLVLYAGLLPLMAALGIGGNKTPFKWAWSEAMGAVFNQLAMALILWVGFQFVTVSVQAAQLAVAHPHALHADPILKQFYALALAVTTFTLTARAPQLLGNLTGHRSAGASHLLAGMALGYLGGQGLAAATKATPAGQAVSMAMQGRESRAQAQVTSWAGRKPLGERLKESKVGQAVSDRAATASAAVGGAIAGSAVGQSVQRIAAAHPGATQVAKNAGAIVGRAAQGAMRPLQTAASMAYQPMSTLGHQAVQGIADSHPEGPSGLLAQSQEATVYMAQHGTEAAAAKYFGELKGYSPEEGITQLGHLVNATITPPNADQGQPGYGVTFAQGAWQGALYEKTQKSVLHNIPITRPLQNGKPSYTMGSRGGSGGSSSEGGLQASYS